MNNNKILRKGGNDSNAELATMGVEIMGNAMQDKQKNDAKKAAENKKMMDKQLKKNEETMQQFEKKTSEIEKKLESENQLLIKKNEQTKKEQESQLKIQLQKEESRRLQKLEMEESKKLKQESEVADNFPSNNSFSIIGHDIITNVNDNSNEETLYNSMTNFRSDINTQISKFEFQTDLIQKKITSLLTTQKNMVKLYNDTNNNKITINNIIINIVKKLNKLKNTSGDKEKKLNLLHNIKVTLNNII